MSSGRFAPKAVLITGGGAGIGAALAAALHARGAAVVIVGQTLAKLAAVAARHPGMEYEQVDVADAAAVQALATRVGTRHPELDAVINNAGVQTPFDFAAPGPLDPGPIAREIDVNFKGLIQVTNAFLPLLKRQPAATLVHVGSGLGFVPLAAVPVYSATKAAVHSFTVSLRRQLAGTAVQVTELIPPMVATELHRDQDVPAAGAMPLDRFIAATMAGLDDGRDEIAVGLARMLRTASRVAPGTIGKLINKARG